MNRPKLSRRTLLRGATGVAVALPFLEAMLPARGARAQAAVGPLRFGVFFTANGVIDADWDPSGGETDFVLSAPLAALTPHREDIVVMRGLDAETSYMQDGNPHDLSMAHMLTAMRMQGMQFGRAGHILDGTAGGPSIDQAIATAIGNETALRSLEIGVESTTTDLEPMVTRMSYGGPNDPRSPLDDPRQVFVRLFGDQQPGSGDEIEALRRQRKTVLDVVLDEFMRVDAALGYEDRQKLDRHATAIRDIESRLESFEPLTCTTPAPPEVTPELVDCVRDGRPNKCLAGFPEIGKVQMDLMVLALACDLSRVVSLQWSTAESTTVHTQLGVTGEHHLMGHNLAQYAPDMTRVNTWYAEQFAYLLSEMKKIPDGEGTLLDNTLLFWPNELSQPESHNRRNLPLVIAGKAAGKIQTGRFLRFDGIPHNQLYAAFLNVFGVPATGFGEPDFPGVLSGLGS